MQKAKTQWNNLAKIDSVDGISHGCLFLSCQTNFIFLGGFGITQYNAHRVSQTQSRNWTKEKTEDDRGGGEITASDSAFTLEEALTVLLPGSW